MNPAAQQKSTSTFRTGQTAQKAIARAAEPELVKQSISGVEQALQSVESAAMMLRDYYHALNESLYPILESHSVPGTYNYYVGNNDVVKSESLAGNSPIENRLFDVSRELESLREVLGDLRMRIRV